MAAAPAGAPAHDDGSDRYVCHDDEATGRHCHKEDETDWEGMPGRLAIMAAVGAAVWLATELLAGDPAPGRGLTPRVRDARPDVLIALYARARESGLLLRIPF